MQLETAIVLLFISPFVIGIIGGLFSSNRNITPIVIDQRTFVSIPEQEKGEDWVFLNNEADSLEESKIIEELLLSIPEETPIEDKDKEFRNTTDLSKEMNVAISDLFKGIQNVQKESIQDQEAEEVQFIRSNNSPVEPNWAIEPPPEQFDFIPYHVLEETLQNEFEEPYPGDAESMDTMPIEQHSSNIPQTQLNKLEQTYGVEAVSRITTTSAMGETAGYHIMIGSISMINNQFVLDNRIRVGGIEIEGEFLVEGMFVREDLFYVEKYEVLQNLQSITQKSEAS